VNLAIHDFDGAASKRHRPAITLVRRLEDGARARGGPGGERRAGVLVVGIFGRDHHALPLGEPVRELPVPGGQVFDQTDPLGDVGRRGRGRVLEGLNTGFGFG
jgi:hypothetical protein